MEGLEYALKIKDWINNRIEYSVLLLIVCILFFGVNPYMDIMLAIIIGIAFCCIKMEMLLCCYITLSFFDNIL